MSFSFLPTIIVDSITELTPEMLQKRGIRLLMLDFDNTIVPYTTSDPTDAMSNWLKNIGATGIEICVVSNSKKDRVKVFCSRYGIDCITHAKKPFQDGISRCLKQYAIDPKEAAIAGDQIFTDTLGGNCAGVSTILVKAIDNHNIWLKLRHIAEKPFIFCARKRRYEHDKS